jgi:hypothetical protein
VDRGLIKLPEPGLGSFRELHNVSQLLTLYLQRRWEEITWGGFSWHGVDNFDGLSALLAPLPVDEASRRRTYTPPGWAAPYEYRHYEDYDECYLQSGMSTAMSSHFLTPQILNDKTEVKGTGYACFKISSWTTVLNGIAVTMYLRVELRRYSETALIDTPFDKIWQPPTFRLWENTATAETKRSYFLELPNLDFALEPTQRLVIVFTQGINSLFQACYFRHLFKRGEAESFVHLPVIEG